jgi:antitoxin VapB
LIRKEGDRLLIEPVPPPRLLALLDTLKPIDETFAE